MSQDSTDSEKREAIRVEVSFPVQYRFVSSVELDDLLEDRKDRIKYILKRQREILRHRKPQ